MPFNKCFDYIHVVVIRISQTMSSTSEVYPDFVYKVRLHPFLHQVSGSNFMFKFDSSTLCKPLVEKEYSFYKLLPNSLKEFTPKYKGGC